MTADIWSAGSRRRISAELQPWWMVAFGGTFFVAKASEAKVQRGGVCVVAVVVRSRKPPADVVRVRVCSNLLSGGREKLKNEARGENCRRLCNV